ncbi:copper transporter [Actinospica durhamensis]|uniref:Copper transporter n=1 Tax=Actinospica durhamensis TaxID=1508375 RepID=A0A941IVD7_9ACTN|nr:copper transporter [Actinospica durhamensis]MBR7836981.1 copper transporter [Actinospica durhamensis]
MIDFRYHVVSIVAVFLALTVGLVIGASILSKGLADSLRGSLAQSNSQIKSQQGQITELKNEVEQRDKYISATAAGLVAHQLDAGCVAVIQIAGADSDSFNAVSTMLQKQSGASICSETTVNAAFTAAGSEQQLSELVVTHTPGGQTLTGTTVQQQAAQLLAEALSTAQPGGGPATVPSSSPKPTATASPGATATPTATASPGAGASGALGVMTASEALKTLKDFQNDGMITMAMEPADWGQANLAYIAAPSTANTDIENQAYLTLAETLRKGGTLPMVGGSGQSADKGGLIAAVIADATASRDIPTVDDTDSVMGQVASVFCLAELLEGGTSVAGHYGTGTDNDGLVPPNLAGLG